MPRRRRMNATGRPWSSALTVALLAVGASTAAAQSVPATPGWHEIPNSVMQTVCPPNGFGGSTYEFRNECPAVTGAWNSAALDTRRNRLLVWGGGHGDYLGNEMYALDLNALSVQRLTDPAVPVADGSTCAEALANGKQPNSRHTYDGIAYIEHADRLFVFGGSLGACGYMSGGTWTFSFASMSWEKRNPRGGTPAAQPGAMAVYDAQTRKVYLHDTATLYSYDVDEDRYTRLASGMQIDYHMTAVIDPVKRKLVLVGAGRVYVYDIGPRSWHWRSSPRTTGGDLIVNSSYPGLAYDPVSGRIVAWHGGDAVYSLDLDTNTWQAQTFPGGPGVASTNGTYKRWSYSAVSGVFVLVKSMESNAYAFRPCRDQSSPACSAGQPVK